MVEVIIDLPKWLYRHFLGMYNLDSYLSNNPCKTLEEYITSSVISMVLDIDPDVKERLDINEDGET